MTTQPVKRQRERARKGEGDRLREEILAAAEDLLLRTGSEELVSIRAVANATGVTAPSIYRHFTDKTELMLEVCSRQFMRLDEELEASMEGIDDPLDRLRARGRAYIEFGRQNPEHYRIMFMHHADATREDWQDTMRDGPFAHLVEGVAAAIDAGALRSTGDAFTTALHIWANVHGLTSLLVTNKALPWPDVDRLIDNHLDVCLLGLAADRSSTAAR